MTIGSEEVHEVDEYDLLVSPEFAPLAEFAGFGEYEATVIQDTGSVIAEFTDRVPAAIATYLTTRSESASLIGRAGQSISEPTIKEWLHRTITGPFDGGLASYIREISHLGENKVRALFRI